MNRLERTKVALKTSFSSPLLENEDWEKPKVLPNPVPLDWIRMVINKRTEMII